MGTLTYYGFLLYLLVVWVIFPLALLFSGMGDVGFDAP